jgi:hypothetical protein
MSEESNIRVVEAYFEALRTKDLSNLPVAEDISFSEPMSGGGVGREALMSFTSGFLPALSDLRVVQHVAQGQYVVTLWEADGVFGTVQVLEKFRIEGGKISDFAAFYDPRPITG